MIPNLEDDSREDLMGDSRKYPYHTTGGMLEFRGKGGGFLDWNSEDVEG